MANPLGTDPDVIPDPSAYDPLSDPALNINSGGSGGYLDTLSPGGTDPYGSGATIDSNGNPYVDNGSIQQQADALSTSSWAYVLNPVNWGLIFGQVAGVEAGGAANGFVNGLESAIEANGVPSLGGNKLAYLMLASFALTVGGFVYLVYRK